VHNDELPVVDGAVLARSVRALAARAQRTLNQPVAEKEVRGLLRAIRTLERQLEAHSSGELTRWATSLRHQVESHVMTVV
jgi:hypothetical protein